MKKNVKSEEKVGSKKRLANCPLRPGACDPSKGCCDEAAGVLVEAPEIAPRIPMDSPDFEQLLTNAEKLNDQSYRGLVYRTYPNEPTCACPTLTSAKPTKKKKKKMQEQGPSCRSGCTNKCCSSLRSGPRRNANEAGKTSTGPECALIANAWPAPSEKTDAVKTGGCCGGGVGVGGGGCRGSRMRGGGSEERFRGYFNGEADFTWYNDRFAVPSRMEGGGGGEIYPAMRCGNNSGKQGDNVSQQNFLNFDDINPAYLALNKCKLRHVEERSNKGSCSCADKDQLDAAIRKRAPTVCTKKPCMGTDCLIKAFNDAQSFVDSLGKVPGLAGLGIIESPYFGKQQESPEIRRAESKADRPAEASAHLCNLQNFDNIGKSSYNPAPSALFSSGARKPGVVQEGATSYPDQSTHATLKSKKKEEKIEKPTRKEEPESSVPQAQTFEDTPCGEPKCKSRPKKISIEEGNAEAADKGGAPQEKKAPPQKPAAGNRQSARGRSHSSPEHPKSRAAKSTPFVYTFGNTYPTNVYGHKDCNDFRVRVPPNMGWFWNKTDTIGNLKPRPGWRPGAISATLRDILKEAKEGFFDETKRPMSAPSKSKKGKPQKTMSFGAMKKPDCRNVEEPEEDIELPPTLHIHRKDGVYYVTMYPIRQETTEAPRVDEPVNPLQFKIVKSKDSLATSSTASDMEIEFSPPAAVNRPRKKPNVVHIETQVNQKEILDEIKKAEQAAQPQSGKGKDGKGKGKGKKK